MNSAQVTVQRQIERVGGGASRCQRDRQDGIGAQAGLGRGPVELNHFPIERRLIGGVEAQQGRLDFLLDVGYGLEHALAQVAALVAITELNGFVFASGRARWNGCAAKASIGQEDICFDRGISARVKDLTRFNFNDFRHIHCFSGNDIRDQSIILSQPRLWGGRPRPRGASRPRQLA